ncbi:protein CURLY FLAG LEAF 2-like [Aristolochia californica]|uniref:protein CURLY FLAG LEAF 2-like n=1 Tax=Aristolochia californica TaxID=171875 RepID=UPI0035E0F086
MVSFQIPFPTNQRSITDYSDDNAASKKRKWGCVEDETTRRQSMASKFSKAQSAQTLLNLGLQLETPLPSEWQQCLDLQSGQVHFYNIRTHKRTNRDPRESPEPFTSSLPMSLDLELNLPCEATGMEPETPSPKNSNDSSSPKESSGLDGAPKSLPWVSLEEGQEEMMAAVCMRCHMLVMLCKSFPTCPNCKFLHPPRKNTSNQFKPTSLRLLCCEDRL